MALNLTERLERLKVAQAGSAAPGQAEDKPVSETARPRAASRPHSAVRPTRSEAGEHATESAPVSIPVEPRPVKSAAVAEDAESAAKIPWAIPGNWIVQNGWLAIPPKPPRPGVQRSPEDEQPTAIGHVLWIEAIVLRESGEQELRVRWDGGGTIITARAITNPLLLSELSARGFIISESARRGYARWLCDLYEANRGILPVERRTGRLGWHGGMFILPDETLTAPGSDAPAVGFQPRTGEAASIAQALTTRRGSLDGWLAAIRPAYEEFPHVAAALCAAFGSLLLDPLRLTEGFIVDLYEKSTCGKTALLRIVATAFGDSEGDQKLVTTWNSTQAGLEERAGTLGAIPLFLDETRERRKNAQLAPYVYMLANGHGADRSTATGGAAERRSWKLTTFSTGEASLTAYVDHAGGALARILPLPGKPWKEKSSAQAKRVNGMVHDAGLQCGWAARAFVRHLLDGDFGTFVELRADYDRRVALFLQRGFEPRLAGDAAVVELTADLLHRGFGLPVPDFNPLWFRARNVSGKPGDERAALDALTSIVGERYRSVIGLEDNDDETQPRRWGEVFGVFRDGKLALHINKTKRLLEELGADYPAAHSAWIDAGLLERDGRNLDPKVVCGPGRPRMLRFTQKATYEVFGLGEPPEETETAGDDDDRP